MSTTEATTRSAPLDGIRALAVLAVFLFHARVSWAQGGFSGLSVFFALSGYLITRNLLREYSREGGIAIGTFWWRRVRRLLPASILAAAATALVAAWRDIPVRPIEMVSAITGWKNWHYLTDYSLTDLFNIWWSLAIEEQYYLVYPLPLLALLTALGRRSAVALGAIAAVSLAWMLVLAHAGSTAEAYYGTHTRLWELLAGCLLALGGTFPRWIRLPAWLALALVLSTVGSSWIDDMPWWVAPVRIVVVVFATVQLIDAIARRPDALPVRILGSGPFRWVGLVSYEVYLVHYAVIVALVPFGWSRIVLVPVELIVTLAAAALLHKVVTPLRAPSR